jgi:hypothetical protein
MARSRSSSASRANPSLSPRSSATERPSPADTSVRLPDQVGHCGTKIMNSDEAAIGARRRSSNSAVLSRPAGSSLTGPAQRLPNSDRWCGGGGGCQNRAPYDRPAYLVYPRQDMSRFAASAPSQALNECAVVEAPPTLPVATNSVRRCRGHGSPSRRRARRPGLARAVRRRWRGPRRCCRAMRGRCGGTGPTR